MVFRIKIMARSPKNIVKKQSTTVPPSTVPPPLNPPPKDIKPILKEPSSSMAIKTPATRTPAPATRTPTPAKCSPVTTIKKPKKPISDDEEDNGDEGQYYDLFMDIITKELPEVNEVSNDVNVRYTVTDFQEDIVCVIADIYETCNFLVVPDQEMITAIANLKIKDKKLQSEFIYGKMGGMSDSKKSCHEKIKEYTQIIRKNEWNQICDKWGAMKLE